MPLSPRPLRSACAHALSLKNTYPLSRRRIARREGAQVAGPEPRRSPSRCRPTPRAATLKPFAFEFSLRQCLLPFLCPCETLVALPSGCLSLSREGERQGAADGDDTTVNHRPKEDVMESTSLWIAPVAGDRPPPCPATTAVARPETKGSAAQPIHRPWRRSSRSCAPPATARTATVARRDRRALARRATDQRSACPERERSRLRTRRTAGKARER
jgi:hypothetical protein